MCVICSFGAPPDRERKVNEMRLSMGVKSLGEHWDGLLLLVRVMSCERALFFFLGKFSQMGVVVEV